MTHLHDPKPYGDGHWARCACGDATFPVTKEAGLSCVPFELWDDDPWGREAIESIKARVDTARLADALEKALGGWEHDCHLASSLGAGVAHAHLDCIDRLRALLKEIDDGAS